MALSYARVRKTPREFPYTSPTTRYFIIDDSYEPVPIVINQSTVRDIQISDPDIYAVWPGQVRSSDMFKIDKLELLKAFL